MGGDCGILGHQLADYDRSIYRSLLALLPRVASLLPPCLSGDLGEPAKHLT